MDAVVDYGFWEQWSFAIPWALCLGSLAWICLEQWEAENRLRRLSRLASTIELSGEAWAMVVRGELTPTEYGEGVERLYAALMREPDDVNEEFHREIFEFPAYLLAYLGAVVRQLAGILVRRPDQRLSPGETPAAVEAGPVGPVSALAC